MSLTSSRSQVRANRGVGLAAMTTLGRRRVRVFCEGLWSAGI